MDLVSDFLILCDVTSAIDVTDLVSDFLILCDVTYGHRPILTLLFQPPVRLDVQNDVSILTSIGTTLDFMGRV